MGDDADLAIGTGSAFLYTASTASEHIINTRKKYFTGSTCDDRTRFKTCDNWAGYRSYHYFHSTVCRVRLLNVRRTLSFKLKYIYA